ncbi:MAG: mechanosensitive ion channel family protein [archaeon]|nr:mechanosensitive ion channel family protein [archaeon]
MHLNETILNYTCELFETLPGTFSTKLAAVALVLFSSFILAYLADIIFEKVLSHLASKTKFAFDDLVIVVLKRPIFYTVSLFGLYIALEIIYPSLAINNILLSLLILVWVFAAVRLNKILFENIISKITEKTRTDIDEEIMPLIKSISDVVIIFIGIMMIMKSVWSFDITPFLASAGIVGFAVAFAAKDTISNLFGGLSIYSDKPFKKGDRIEIGDGEIGIVAEVGLRSTKIRNFYNNTIIIPNNQIANSKIINYNYPHSKMMVKVAVGVAYGSNVAKVKKVLLKIAENIDEVLDDPEPNVRFDNHGNFSLDFALILWVDNPKDKLAVIDKVNVAIDKEFRKEKIDIPFPTQTILMQK